jgi:hypothetical protein
MGRKATEFTVRGYLIQFVRDANDLYRRDYTKPRDALQARLDAGGPGSLQLPMMAPMTVVCTRYRMSEDEKAGGYVAFDMTFVELGVPPFNPTPSAVENLKQQSENLKQQVIGTLTPTATTRIPLSRAPAAIAGGAPFSPGG